jgi:hypothetical protein
MAAPREHLRREVEEAAREPRQVLEDRGAAGKLSDHGWWSRLRWSGPTLWLLRAAAVAELSDHAAAGRGGGGAVRARGWWARRWWHCPSMRLLGAAAAELSDHAAAGQGDGGAVRPRGCWARRRRRRGQTPRLLYAAAAEEPSDAGYGAPARLARRRRAAAR